MKNHTSTSSGTNPATQRVDVETALAEVIRLADVADQLSGDYHESNRAEADLEWAAVNFVREHAKHIAALLQQLAERDTEVERLRQLAGCAYQMAGVHDAPEPWLDALSDAANGTPIAIWRVKGDLTDALLPYLPEAVDWLELFRLQTATRYMENDLALSRDDAYRMADEDIERHKSAAVLAANGGSNGC